MKTTIYTLALSLITITTLAQQVAFTTTGVRYHAQPTSTISSYTLEVIEAEDFRYRNYLKETKNTSQKYRIGATRVDKETLTRLFRKTARQSSDANSFKATLRSQYPRLYDELNDMELSELYTQFKKGSVSAYLNELPSIL